MTRPTIFTEITAGRTRAAPRARTRILGVDPGAVGGTITVGVEGVGAGVVVVGLQQAVLELVLDGVRLVGGLDVHEGHRSLAVLIFGVAEDLYALHSTKPEMIGLI